MSRVRFGIFEADLSTGELYKRGLKAKIQEQPFQVLAMLIERPGEIISRQELRKRLWPDTVVDFDRGLNKAINRLREVLSDDAENARFIETIPQRGYRFLAPVEAVRPEYVPDAKDTGALARRRDGSRVSVAIAVVFVAVVLVGIGYYRLKVPWQRIESLAVLPLENLSGDPAQEYFSDGLTDELIGEIAAHQFPARHFADVGDALQGSAQVASGDCTGAERGCDHRRNGRPIRRQGTLQRAVDPFAGRPAPVVGAL